MKRERELRELLVEVDENRRRLMGAYFTGIGLTVGQGQPRILNTLLDREGITQRELADACRFDVTTISRTLNHLEKAGFIRRESDPQSRRCYLIVLTEKGRETAEKVRLGYARMEEILPAGMEPEEKKTLKRELEKLLDNLRSVDAVMNQEE